MLAWRLSTGHFLSRMGGWGEEARRHGRSLLAVQRRHALRVVAVARRGAFGDRLFDRCEVGAAELHLDGADRFGETVAAAGAEQRDDVAALCRHPGDRDLG